MDYQGRGKPHVKVLCPQCGKRMTKGYNQDSFVQPMFYCCRHCDTVRWIDWISAQWHDEVKDVESVPERLQEEMIKRWDYHKNDARDRRQEKKEQEEIAEAKRVLKLRKKLQYSGRDKTVVEILKGLGYGKADAI
jgi:hypothetical protein